MRTGHDVPAPLVLGDGRVAVFGPVGDEGGHRLGLARRQLRIAGVRHDGDQAEGPLGVLDGQRLGDHAAHRQANDVGAGLAEMVQQRHRVGGHVAQGVGRRIAGEVVHRGHDVGNLRRRRRHPGGQPHVAVVHGDDPVARLREPIDQARRPVDDLARQAMQQQQRRISPCAPLLVVEIQVGVAESGHVECAAANRKAANVSSFNPFPVARQRFP